jgi:hypothetical protein
MQNINHYINNLGASIGNIGKFTNKDQKRSNDKFIKDIGYEMPVFTETKDSVITTFRSAKHEVSCTISKPKTKSWEENMGVVPVSVIKLIVELAVGDRTTGQLGDIHTLGALSSIGFAQSVNAAMNECAYTNRYRLLNTRLWRSIGFSVCLYRLRACYMMDEMEREGATEGEVLIASYQAKAAHENATSNTNILALGFPTAEMKVSVV